ncbi:hypothetical protein SAY87_015813 [Trapa incisa]|uniref:Probable 6-phosphogluconolactonase n=1 Tax=Trapa incisa TaxID=236973 RepID=A0AAN7LFX2_9MYRT|nr:hypothetical protein SAY87_015813 [Trapa incisa]
MAVSGIDPKRTGELRIHETLDELRTDLADYIAELSEVTVKERGVFSLAISGGCIIDTMGKLCEAPYNKTVDWAKWHVFWADERVVAKSHPDSNYKLAKDGLFSKVPIIPSHMHSINDNLSSEEAANEYEFVIRQLVKTRVISASEVCDCPKFDLILLEIGHDGHIASLFPGHTLLDEKDEWVTFITDSPVAPPERITFTLPVINSASNVALVAMGEDKSEVLQSIVNDGVEPDCNSLPAKMVQPGSSNLVWFLDKAAALKLQGPPTSE